MSVDLPAPFSPATTWTSPGIISRSTLSTARTPRNSLETVRNLTTGALVSGGFVSGNDIPSSFLQVGQRVRGLARGGVELTVYPVELVVDPTVLRPRLDGLRDGVPVGVGLREPDGPRGQQGVPVGGPDGLLGQVLRPAGHVGDDLGPQPSLRPAPDRHQPLSPAPCVAHELEDVPYAVSRRLEHRPVEVA